VKLPAEPATMEINGKQKSIQRGRSRACCALPSRRSQCLFSLPQNAFNHTLLKTSFLE